MRLTSLLAAVTVTAGALVAAAAPARAADVHVDLPSYGFADLLVDTVHSRVLVSGGGRLVVRDLNGNAVYDFPSPGAAGLALSPDSTRLYVANASGDAVDVWEASSLWKMTSYATGSGTCPRSLAAVGTSLWFGYGCSGGNVGLLDLSGETPVVTLAKAPAEATHLTLSPPRIEVTPDGSRMLAAALGGSTSYLYSLTVSGGTLGAGAVAEVGGNLADLALTPDGTKVVTAAATPYHHARWNVADLTADGTFGDGLAYPTSAAATSGFVAAGTYASNDDDVRVYAADGALVREYELGRRPEPGGLAFAPDGATLYAVSAVNATTPLRLHVLRDPTRPQPTLTLVGPATRRVGTAYTLTGSLLGGPGEGTTLHVTRASGTGTVALPDVVTGPDGAFSFSDTVGKRGGYTYTVTYDGDETYLGASKGIAFGVAGLIPTLSITTNKSPYRFHESATVVARLSTWSTGKRMSLTASAGSTYYLKTGDGDANGYLSVNFTITRRTAFTVRYVGDDVYEPRQVSVLRDVYVGLTTILDGYYTTQSPYRVYRRTANPVVRTYVQPVRSGTCMTFEAQEYRSGAWRTIARNTCIRLDQGGQVTAVLTGTHPVGVPHRVRAMFPGDAMNLRTYGPWHYLRFTT